MANYTQRPRRISNVRVVNRNYPFFIRFIRNLLPWAGDQVTEMVRKVVFIGAFSVFVYSAGTLAYDWYDAFIVQINIARQLEKQITIDLDPQVVSDYKNEQPQGLLEYALLYQENSDFVGWVRVGNGQDISFPVVQTMDNNFYLDHNFKKEYSKSGNIFADYRNVISPEKTSANIVLYGHNFAGGTQFAKLSRYIDSYTDDPLSYYKQNPVIYFDTLYEKGAWKVFAAVLFNVDQKNGEVYPYHNIHDFDSKETFNQYILDIMDRSRIFTDVDITYGDQILTLSTCYYPYGESIDTRAVIFARKVREGESVEVDTSKAVYNNNWKKFEYENKYFYPWTGRTWDTSKLLSYED